MKGDIVVLHPLHEKVAGEIVPKIIEAIKDKEGIYSISVAGESGSGKSEIALAISDELEKIKIKAIILGQDDYFYLPPKSNSERRHENPDWLGPHIEINLVLLEENIRHAKQGKTVIHKPLVDYNANTIETQVVELDGIKVIIAEGTYTSLLKNIDTKIFINRNWQLTLEDRKKRNRGNEIRDPFTENILATEHKIIAGHIYLADFVVTEKFDVLSTEPKV